MRYRRDHKENTHRRVVEVAAARFRKEGLDSVGVASLMGDAGLTHGGFYSHFASKEALIEEVVEAGMEESFARIIETSKGVGSRPSFGLTCDRAIVNIPRGAVQRRRSGRKLEDIRRRRGALSPESCVEWFPTSLCSRIQMSR